ncbi:MAG: hypothetical protein AAB595_01780 [Patescibacteria group bacterium]
MPKLKNIIIFLTIGAVFVFIYFFYIKGSSSKDGAPLVSSSSGSPVANGTEGDVNSSITQDFLALLLNVKNIKLDDAIFSDNAFTSLHDSSITLTPDGTEGRPNPFAPLGTDVVIPPVASSNSAGASASAGASLTN